MKNKINHTTIDINQCLNMYNKYWFKEDKTKYLTLQTVNKYQLLYILNTSFCNICTALLANRSVMCNVCRRWICEGCTNLSEEEFDIISSPSSRFVCAKCAH